MTPETDTPEVETAEAAPAEATVETQPEVVQDAEAPTRPKMTVKRRKVSGGEAAPVSKDDAEPTFRNSDGPRTETDEGPVQGTNFLGAPREVEDLMFGDLMQIKRIRN